MAKLDKLLDQIITHGASKLFLEPGQPPILELPGGHRKALGAMELLGTVLDGLAREVLPKDGLPVYQRGEEVSFTHPHGESSFDMRIYRRADGPRVLVTRSAGKGEAAEQAAGMVAGHSAGPVNVGLASATHSRFDWLLARMLDSGASDLYMNCGEPPLLRRHGRVEALEGMAPPSGTEVLELVKPLAPAMSWSAFGSGANITFAHVPTGRPCRLRMSLCHDAHGPSLAMRAMPSRVPDADTLGLPETVRRLAAMNRGLVLVAGPLGSGKTTTLAALVDLANQQRNGFIVILEDAVEFVHAEGRCRIRQRETSGDPERLRKAIRAALTQAPDILVVDEVHDAATMELLMEAAANGPLVLAGLAAPSALTAIHHAVGLFPPEAQADARSRLATCLKAVVCQLLLARTQGGRTAAFETLFCSPAMSIHLREGRFSQIPAALKSAGRSYGQVTQNEALVKLIQGHALDPMEAYLHCLDREGFIEACRKANVQFDPRASRETEV